MGGLGLDGTNGKNIRKCAAATAVSQAELMIECVAANDMPSEGQGVSDSIIFSMRRLKRKIRDRNIWAESAEYPSRCGTRHGSGRHTMRGR